MQKDNATLFIARAAPLTRQDDIPWSLIAGMRDHLTHAYDTVDWEEVWKTTSRDIPDLLIGIEPLFHPSPG